MKIHFYIVLLLATLIACDKKQENISQDTTIVTNDSLIRSIQNNWKFSVNLSNSAVNSRLSTWSDWQNFVSELTTPPKANLSNFSRKAAKLVTNVEVLKNSVPDFYNKPETKARLTLLETNVQNLDMWLDIEPLNSKEILSLLANIQKNTNSIIYQFEEFEVKAKIPREVGEESLHQPIDTIKRAKLTAILNSNED